MADFLAWSHSRRKMFLDCPKQLYHTAVLKKGDPLRVDFVQSKAMLDGNEIDNALTKRIGEGVPLPPKFAIHEEMVQNVIAAPGTKFTQMQLALDAAFKPCAYKDWDNAWVRSIYDLAIINGAHAYLWDWKNGMVWMDPDQLKLFAAVGFHTFPELEVVDTSYVWLKHGVTTDATYRRKDLPDLWNDLLPDVERMQVAFRTNTWPALPKDGPRTCKRCPVNAAKKCDRAAGPYGG